MKGQLPIVEAVIASIVLFVAFNMIITVQEYQTKWEDSLSLMQGRDMLITADRLGRLHEYPFSPAFEIQLLSKIDAIKDDIVKNETQGTVRNTVYVACDCTTQQQEYVQNILKDVKFNARGITGTVCPTTLPAINSCSSGIQYPDALIIWGYKNLGPSVTALTNYAKEGGGIIEIADLDSSQANDASQQAIFGIKWTTRGSFPPEQIQFLKPRNTSIVTYQSYKWFHRLPYNFTLTQNGADFLMEDGTPIDCDSGKTGSFKFQDNSYQFWVCTNNRVYFDTNQPQNGKANTDNATGEIIPIGVYKFRLNYIDSTSKIRISFKSPYLFNDFLFVDGTHNKIYPLNDDANKILLSKGYWDIERTIPVSAAILNRFENSVTVWLPDFGRGGLSNTGDDHKQLLASLILSISDRQTKETPQIGQITSYINVNATDILEIYRIDLSIGRPF